MRLFKRKSKSTPKEKPVLLQKFDGYYDGLKSVWATWLNKRTALFSKKDWLTVLGILVITMGGYCGYLIYQGFSGTTSIFKAASIDKPIGLKNGIITTTRASPLPEIEKVIAFDRFMDSLAKDPIGRKLYDSIIQKRPGLMDSIKQIENNHQHFKNK